MSAKRKIRELTAQVADLEQRVTVLEGHLADIEAGRARATRAAKKAAAPAAHGDE